MDVTSKLMETFSNLTSSEKDGLEDLLRSGDPSRIKSLYDIDYKEIPVSIDRFISDPEYLGSLYDNGKLIYPYWREFMHNFFHNNPDKAYEVALSGAIGLGKSTIAAVMMTYIIYRTLCLRDPRKFYSLTGNSPIVFVVMNLTLDLAYGGLYTLIVENIRNSPWFKERVDVRGKYDFIIEFGDGIQLMAGSTTTHVIGKNVISACVTGDTEILTASGYKPIGSITDELVRVATYRDGRLVFVEEPVRIQETNRVTELYEIELGDGTVLRCTSDHRFLLKDGTYKYARDLTLEDELEEVSKCTE